MTADSSNAATGTATAEQGDAPRLLPKFFLRELHIKNFRTIEDAIFQFQPGLNVLIGENNSGKTAVVDALRLVLNLGTFENKEDFIRPRAADARLSSKHESDEEHVVTTTFVATFMGDDAFGTSAQFYELLTSEPQVHYDVLPEAGYSTFRLSYRVDFRFNSQKVRFEISRTEIRGGDTLENPLPAETLDGIRAIYLAPLRDLVNDRSRVGSEIERLILSHTPTEKNDDRRAVPEKVRELAEQLINDLTGGKHQAAAGASLATYSTPYGISPETLTFAPTGISDSLLNTMVPLFDHSILGVSHNLPLSSNGLGINQLIYASIVLSRQGVRATDSYLHRFFVIEEPEAHLHPQLQDSFFHALNQIRDHQIFVTSHSPTITAKTDIEKMTTLQRDKTSGAAVPSHLALAYEGRESDRRYLHKFLDVTRSQLLFARGAIFVEGVTEAMLLEQFSQILGLSLRDHAIEVVVVDSSHGFDRFRPLFEGSQGALARAAFVTDSDVPAAEVTEDFTALSNREGVLDDIETLVEGRTMVARGYGTFEFALLCSALAGDQAVSAQQILRSSMVAAAPPDISDLDKRELFAADFMDFENPALSYKKMKQSSASGLVPPDQWRATWHTNSYFRSAKSDFSYHLSAALDEPANGVSRANFPVPNYIKSAIDFVTAGRV